MIKLGFHDTIIDLIGKSIWLRLERDNTISQQGHILNGLRSGYLGTSTKLAAADKTRTNIFRSDSLSRSILLRLDHFLEDGGGGGGAGGGGDGWVVCFHTPLKCCHAADRYSLWNFTMPYEHIWILHLHTLYETMGIKVITFDNILFVVKTYIGWIEGYNSQCVY